MHYTVHIIPRQTIRVPRDTRVTAITLSSDDRYIIAGTMYGNVYVWEMFGNKNIAPITITHPSPLTYAYVKKVWSGLSPSVFFVGRLNGEIEQWDVNDLACLVCAERYACGHARLYDFSCNAFHVLSSSAPQKGILEITDVKNGNTTTTLAHNGMIYDAQYSLDGRLIATLGQCNDIKLWCSDTLSMVCHVETSFEDHFVRSILISPNGQRVATLSGNGQVCVWDLKTKQCTISLNENAHVVAFSRDGMYLACGGWNNQIQIFNVCTGDIAGVCELDTDSYPLHITFQNTEHFIVVVCNHGYVHVY